MSAHRLAAYDAPEHVLDPGAIDVELAEVVADVLVGRVAEERQLRGVRAQDDAVGPDPVDPDRSVLEERIEVLAG